MLKLMLNRKKVNFVFRIFLGLTSLLLIATAAGGILSGKLNYANYWGGLVFAPFAILFGLLMLYAIIFRWKRFNEPSVDEKGEKIRFPADDYKKW